MTNSHRSDTVLVVDDQPANLKVLLAVLQEAGFQILVANSGERALQLVSRQRPDIILLDVMMPGIDGFETCRRLKADSATAEIPVIFMTALTDLEDELQGFSVGGVDYITKPFQQQKVLARLNAQLTILRQQKEIRKKNEKLARALAEIKQLSGILPICCRCRKVRDDDGYWKQVEQYITEHTDAEFSHGFCPDCYEEEMNRIMAHKQSIDQDLQHPSGSVHHSTLTPIFLHGLDSSSRGTKGSWLHQHFPQVLTPDFNGDLAARLAQLEQLCRGKEHLLLIGSSFGGLMAACYAATHPDRCSRLLLLAPALNFPEYKVPEQKITVPTQLVIGEHDTVTPPALVLPLARESFSRLRITVCDDDHLLHNSFTQLEWKKILAGVSS